MDIKAWKCAKRIMGISFVALDFETANANRASACALAMTKVVDGEITDSLSAIFMPSIGFDFFEARNTSIHGISRSEVEDKGSFVDYWKDFANFAQGLPLVAHNASFDLSVLRATLHASNLSWPEFEYACTYIISQRVFSLTSYSLPFVAVAAKIDWDKDSHHDALYDSQICAKVLIEIAHQNGSPDFASLLDSLNMEMGLLYEDGWYSCRSLNATSRASNSREQTRTKIGEVVVNSEASHDHPMFGKKVVFTGALYSMTRPEAWNLVAKVGAIPKDSMSKTTDYLVVGEQDPLKLKPGEVQSSKFREAEKLRENGFGIQVISETDFLAILEPQQGKFNS